ncbi:MAG: IS3 family transposase [Candidatus Pacebacteria bacterium]|nr:IS3 family transposase [Candidatus Paceibacterota bacterium]MDD2757463.1 IS3 family transposase [Candidatus Paceibacterota bacterium]MDD3283933.1 IS3 family transposase [Candidatus Paceibacterota bacterium]MDD3969797.1 IS3 family transposase [Candidatus Paceibacterota bacterium]MDD4738112.1 IS3 family transposase [Candidatus Paceibacterota bacterium]
MKINEHAPPKNKKELAFQLGISRQSLYYKPKLRDKDLKLKAEIERIMLEHKAYGHRRIAITLNVNKKRVLRVMKLFNLKPKKRRKWTKPGDIKQKATDIPNLIAGMIVNSKNEAWVSDFTYIPYHGRFVYLATIEDIYTREAIGWDVSLRHNAELVMQALLNALKKNKAGAVAHSDQGSEYKSKAYANLLESFNIKQSMFLKGSPWQNGYQESFYSNFKLEFDNPGQYDTLGELVEAIAHQIYYYNNERIHTALKCPPTIFRKRIEQRIAKVELNTLKSKQIRKGLCV